MVQAGKLEPLLQLAARRAFWDAPKSFVERVARTEGIDFSQGDNLVETLFNVCCGVLADLPESDIMQIFCFCCFVFSYDLSNLIAMMIVLLLAFSGFRQLHQMF